MLMSLAGISLGELLKEELVGVVKLWFGIICAELQPD
jgi:hypothetical protein